MYPSQAGTLFSRLMKTGYARLPAAGFVALVLQGKVPAFEIKTIACISRKARIEAAQIEVFKKRGILTPKPAERRVFYYGERQ